MPKIKKITRDANRPVLFDFQNGKIKVDNECNLQVTLFKDKVKNKKVLGVSNGNMIYMGKINNDDLFNNFLAISKKGGKEIELVEIDTTTLTPFLKQKLAVNSPVKQQSVSDLHKKFGSKKARRYTEQQERLTMNIENVTGRLEEIVQDIDISKIPTLPDTTESESIYRPKINREASSKEGVYLLSDLVRVDILDTLEKKVEEILQSEDIKSFVLIPIVESNILALKTASISEQTLIDKCKMLLYVHNLVEFMKTPLKKITKKYVLCEYSIDVDKHIKQNFMIDSTRSLNMKDKCLCYIIVLLMIALDYEMDLDPLSKDTKIGLKKLKDIARNLGFSQSSKSKAGITLKIPVPPPLNLFVKRKRNSI